MIKKQKKSVQVLSFPILSNPAEANPRDSCLNKCALIKYDRCIYVCAYVLVASM